MTSQKVSKKTLAQHNSKDDCWVAVHGKVYDVTKYLSSHPGGFDMLFDAAGKDCTDDFEMFGHSDSAVEMLAPMLVGDLVDEDEVSPSTLAQQASAAPATVVILPTAQELKAEARKKLVYLDMVLKKVEKLSADSANFTFHFPDDTKEAKDLLNLAPGNHIDLKIPTFVDGLESYALRSYTPIRTHPEEREVVLLVKSYLKGIVSTYIHAMQIGDKISVKGPIPSFDYDSAKYKNIVMIAGGTGIAPMYQICTSTASADKGTKLILIDANRTEEDILLRKELDEIAEKMREKFDLHYILSQPKGEWKKEKKGHINSELISSCVGNLKQEHPATYKVLVCGPPGFVQTALGLLDDHGIPKDCVHVY